MLLKGKILKKYKYYPLKKYEGFIMIQILLK